MTARLCFFLCLVACAAPRPPLPNTIYRPKPNGAIDLGPNENARHCSELTSNFHDAYRLEDGVKTILSLTVVPDESRMFLRTSAEDLVPASTVIGDDRRLRGFWYHDDWTLALTLDHRDCPDGACPAQIYLIKYNGARTPNERVTKQCFERWVGAFKRVAPDAPRKML